MNDTLQKQLHDAEQHLEKVKAELYSTVGRIATLKEIIQNSSVEPKQEAK